MRIPNDRLREAVLASDVTMTEIARRCELYRPDERKVSRLIGLKDSRNTARTGNKTGNVTIDYDMAEKIAEAIGADPVEVGL